MTPSQAGYAIHPSSPEATEIGLTPDRFGPGTSLWREGISLWFSHLEILGLHPRKVLHDLVARTNARGLIAVIPQDGETVDRELLEWGFVLQSFACKDGRRVPAYLRGPPGLPLVHAEYEKFGVRLVVTDEGNDLGITVRAETPGTAVTMTVTPGSIQTETMTRIHRIETCDGLCPHAVGSRGCRHPEALWDDAGIIRIRPFEDFPHIPVWCPLEQVGPDWRPPEPPQTEPPRDDRNFREALREVVETRPQKGPRWMRQGSGLRPARRERG